MLKKIVSFLDNHRFILVLLILFLIVLVFLSFKTYIFLNYDFEKLKCTRSIDDIYCYNNNIKIYKNPEIIKEKLFSENKDSLEKLKNDFSLPEFSLYTAYYYEIVLSLTSDTSIKYQSLYTFFDVYNNTYNLEEFYIKNNLFFKIFYPYKIF